MSVPTIPRRALRSIDPPHSARKVQGSRQLVSAVQAREHLDSLAAAGMSHSEVESRSGVNRMTLVRIERAELQRISWTTAQRLLQVEPLGHIDQRHGWVDATGTRRRLRALSRQGWPASELAARLGTSQSGIRRLLEDGHGCSARTRAAVVVLYDALWNCTPEGTKASRLAARRAESRGWAAPASWDDDEIDDPVAVPHFPAAVGSPTDHLLENVEWLLNAGESRIGVASRLGLKADSVCRSARRHGRPDIAERMGAAS